MKVKAFRFFAEWCSPCKALSKKLEGTELEKKLISIDCDEDEEDLCSKFEVRNIPTIIIADENDNILARFSGTSDTIISDVTAKIKEFEEDKND